MAGFQIDVATGSGTPIYRQIVDQVRLAVATGALAAGDAMPSVRSLAERLVINANTVAKAYAELVRDGVLESQQGLGFFVANKKRQVYSRAERLRRLQPGPRRLRPRGGLPRLHRRRDPQAVDEKLADLDLQPKPAGERA